MQPGCTKKGAIKLGLMTRARGYKNPLAIARRLEWLHGGIKDHSSMAGSGRKANESGIHQKKQRRKNNTLCKSRCGAETLQMAIETLNVLPRACAGYQYKKMVLENPPTNTSELTSLPTMNWKRFAKDLYDERIEQLCILSDRDRMTNEAKALRQLFIGSASESEGALSTKTKKERFEVQSLDSPKSSPYYEILREHRDALLDEISAGLPEDKGIGHKAGKVQESKSTHRAPTFCVQTSPGGWRIVHA
ncbi:reverse transcriptase [Phytophthora megakarya]|uniref:Reverse transcriptase n=1 Tax=Phytophthora megakarya TaxID=4795 RepID=A0A225X4I2_9STRA|nr:reverse transcriptase [Phytophthora megakarya]